MSAPTRQPHDSAASRHLAAVARSLEWAAEAAERGDHADALGWLRAVEASGERLSDEFETKRRFWLSVLATGPSANRSTGEAS